MPPVKPYRAVPIRECGEELIAVPCQEFAFFEPHPYMAVGAPYGNTSPWVLRRSVVAALRVAQGYVRQTRPGWGILLFDAYRPNAVLAFMVARELTLLAQAEGLDPASLPDIDRARLMNKVYRVWAIPSDDPATPSPHSTGAAVDCTLMDETGREVAMGSPIDENSDRSYPDYFAAATDEQGKLAHAHRALLNDCMVRAGFRRNPGEWWHFSRGDQLAIWIDRAENPDAVAIYGRI